MHCPVTLIFHDGRSFMGHDGRSFMGAGFGVITELSLQNTHNTFVILKAGEISLVKWMQRVFQDKHRIW